jgi:hypothetical protein
MIKMYVGTAQNKMHKYKQPHENMPNAGDVPQWCIACPMWKTPKSIPSNIQK